MCLRTSSLVVQISISDTQRQLIANYTGVYPKKLKYSMSLLEAWSSGVPVTEIEALAVRLAFLEHTDAGAERRRVLLIVGAMHTHTQIQ